MPGRRLLIIASAAILTACTTTPPATESAAPTPEPPILEPGDFDPDGDFTVFDPCTEIPATVLAQAGLGEPVGEPYYDGNRSAMCSFEAADPTQYPGVFSLVGDRNPKSKLEAQGLLLEGVEVEVPMGFYLHTLPGDLGSDCSAAVHTKRGRVIVMYTEVLSDNQRQHFCAATVPALETIYSQLGENNGSPYRS